MMVEAAGKDDNPNYPLKGFKGPVYEGGTKVPAFIHSPLIQRAGYRYNGLFHMVDFLPTLVNLAAGRPLTENLDGVDQWAAIVSQGESPRKSMVYNLDDNFVPAVLDMGEETPKMFQVGVRRN